MLGSKKGKAVIIFIVLLIIALGLAGATFYLLQNEHLKNTQLQVELDNVNKSKQLLESKLEDSRKSISGLQGQLKENTDKVSSLTKELDAVKLEKENTLSTMQQLQSELDELKLSRAELEKKLDEAQESTKNMQNALDTLEASKKELEGKVSELEEKAKNVELGKIVVSPDTAAQSSEASSEGEVSEPEVQMVGDQVVKEGVKIGNSILEGKILVVNREYDFFVVNLGKKDGISVGDKFAIYHADKYIGDAQVEKLHDAMASATFATALRQQISDGDKVVLKIK